MSKSRICDLRPDLQKELCTIRSLFGVARKIGGSRDSQSAKVRFVRVCEVSEIAHLAAMQSHTMSSTGRVLMPKTQSKCDLFARIGCTRAMGRLAWPSAWRLPNQASCSIAFPDEHSWMAGNGHRGWRNARPMADAIVSRRTAARFIQQPGARREICYLCGIDRCDRFFLSWLVRRLRPRRGL